MDALDLDRCGGAAGLPEHDDGRTVRARDDVCQQHYGDLHGYGADERDDVLLCVAGVRWDARVGQFDAGLGCAGRQRLAGGADGRERGGYGGGPGRGDYPGMDPVGRVRRDATARVPEHDDGRTVCAGHDVREQHDNDLPRYGFDQWDDVLLCDPRVRRNAGIGGLDAGVGHLGGQHRPGGADGGERGGYAGR